MLKKSLRIFRILKKLITKIMLQNMAFKILLDANVLIEFLLERDKFEESQRLLKETLYFPNKVFVTPAIIHITSYWVKKSLGIETTKSLLLELLEDIETIDC